MPALSPTTTAPTSERTSESFPLTRRELLLVVGFWVAFALFAVAK